MSVQQVVKQFDRDDTPISFIRTSSDGSAACLDRLEPSFMYTQLLRNILLSMNHSNQARSDLVQYWKTRDNGDESRLAVINEFDKTYRSTEAIRWYSRPTFVFEELNRALRLLQADIIVNMGFFLHDLHQQIKQLHQEQLGDYKDPAFSLYRGQGLSTEDFTRLQNTSGGLVAFNSFLSISQDRAAPLCFAESCSMKENTIGILFVLHIDHNVTSTPFADVTNISCFGEEKEVLFSMHSVFRIGEIKPLTNGEQKIYEVHLALTANSNEDLQKLTECMEKDLTGDNDWIRLGKVLIMPGDLGTAEKLYIALLKQRPNTKDEGHYYHHLGLTMGKQADYEKAIGYYKVAIRIREKIFHDTIIRLASAHRKIALRHRNMNQTLAADDYEKEADKYERLIGLLELPAFVPSLNEEDNSETLLSVDEVIASRGEILVKPLDSLASSYNNIGVVYINKKKYTEALSHHNRAFEIREGILPPGHLSLAVSLHNIATVYFYMERKEEAFQVLKKALAIAQGTLVELHPDSASMLKTMGKVLSDLGQHSDAMICLQKALSIQKRSLHTNHVDLPSTYADLGTVYFAMGKYRKALDYHQKALDIWLTARFVDRKELGTCYNNIGVINYELGSYPEALKYFANALITQEQLFESLGPYAMKIRVYIAMVYQKLWGCPSVSSE